MQVNLIPENEDARLNALRRYTNLHAGREQVFEDLARLVTQICGVPISLINLIEQDEVQVQAAVGLSGVKSLARQHAICAHTILGDDTLVVPDTREDARFQDNPTVAGESGVRFYAGTPLTSPDGFKLGTLCVMDLQPRRLTDEQLSALKIIGRQVMSQMELRHNLEELAVITRKALALENLMKKYTSRSVWEKADFSVAAGHLDIVDEEVERTYLFIDVVSFTRLSERLGAKGTVELLNEYFKAMVDIIVESGGDIDKFVGDQIFCSFADSRTAVAAALRVKQAMKTITDGRNRSGDLTLDFTMGMSSGRAIRANVGGADRRDNTFIGNVVNVAARLQGACEAGGLLIEDALYRQVQDRVRIVRSHRYKLKNLENVVQGHYIEQAS